MSLESPRDLREQLFPKHGVCLRLGWRSILSPKELTRGHAQGGLADGEGTGQSREVPVPA